MLNQRTKSTRKRTKNNWNKKEPDFLASLQSNTLLYHDIQHGISGKVEHTVGYEINIRLDTEY